MRKLLPVFTFILVILLLISCSAYPDYHAPTGGSTRFDGDTAPFDTEDKNDTKPGIQAGQLTAAHWNDHVNYRFWQGLFASSQAEQEGQFTSFHQKGFFDTLNMIEVLVKYEGEPVIGANLLLMTKDEVLYQAKSNVKGIAYLFPQTDDIDTISQIKVNYLEEEQVIPYLYEVIEDKGHGFIEIEVSSEYERLEQLDLMFVIDTTGSMGDEIFYLQAEIVDVISRIKNSNDNIIVNLALLFYRDIGDEYLTRYFDFTTDIEAQQANLKAQRASGGGDYPEAVDIALDEAVNKQWASGNSTKIIILVLDAPPHTDRPKDMERYTNSINMASEKGIRIIPVASSGVDKMTEYLLRSSALLTGGDYIFITNDSGIGNDHIEPSTGEVIIEYLNGLIVRIVNYHITGVLADPVPYYQK